ncbi:unnamed protein product [Phytophthora fragariaefolia]|uniref:Sugar transporter SWEET1 n=1 Tax=Phytophthora fragariaefolia TaxID=1490495 RepID=A0A9W6Y9I5_9STRA|nr:unnamed protein product [Phytophthora fragariaefolia]
MSGTMGALEATFQVLTVISSIFVRVAPWPDFQRVYKAKSTGEVQILPVVMLFTNCVVLVWYGYLSENIFPLFVTAMMGLATCGGFIAVFYRYADDKRSVLRVCAVALAVIVLVCLYGTIGVAGVTGQSKSSLATAMGAISIGTSIGLYGSPLATIRRVVCNKSTASMPFTLCLANFFNSVCWVVYAVIILDVWVLLPNAFGCVLTTIQLILYVIYPTATSTETQLQSVMIDHPGTISEYEREATLSVIISTQENERNGRKIVRTKSTASMPFTLSLANFTNGAVWIVYSVMIKDIWVFIPNVMGFVLSSIQMAIYAIYPSTSDSDLQLETVVVCPSLNHKSSLSITIATPSKDKLEHQDSLDFEAIRSPPTRCLSSAPIDYH